MLQTKQRNIENGITTFLERTHNNSQYCPQDLSDPHDRKHYDLDSCPNAINDLSKRIDTVFIFNVSHWT